MLFNNEVQLNVMELGLSTLEDSQQGFPKGASNDGIEFFITVKVFHSVAFQHITRPGFEISINDKYLNQKIQVYVPLEG